MSFYDHLYKTDKKSVKYYNCHLHIHPRIWIHAPCHTTADYFKRKFHSSIENGITFNMESTKFDDRTRKKCQILDDEISVLEAAKITLERGGQLSDDAKKVVKKWQKSETVSIDGHKNIPKIKHKERIGDVNSVDDARSIRSCVDGKQNGIIKVKEVESKKIRTRINRDYQTENRKLREKFKELSRNSDKIVNGKPLELDQSNTLLKKKYENLLTYVLKVEAENQHLKKAINPNDSESGTESLFDPFKLRIRHLERKILDQEATINQYENNKISEDKNIYEEELLHKLTTTRDIYETALQGYKDQIKHLMIECSQLKILNEDLTNIKSTIDSEYIDLAGETEIFADPVQKLEDYIGNLTSNSDKESILKRLQFIISSVEDTNSHQLVEEANKKYEDLEDKYISAIHTIEQLSKKLENDIAVEDTNGDEIASPPAQNDSELERRKNLLSHSVSPSPVHRNASPKSDSELNQSLHEHITTLKENNRVLQEHVGYLEERLTVLLKEMNRKDEILDRLSGQLDTKIRDCFDLSKRASDEVESRGNSSQIKELRGENDRLISILEKVKDEKRNLEKSFRTHAYSLEEQVDQLSLKNTKFQKQLDTIISIYKATFNSGEDLNTFTWIQDFVDRKSD